ncbi:hypothetical protein M569_09251 [Genlisea aurea]|uniref:Uncharacterized protein n=1 Tax=Genlisea aurea TaxID=192259 RepID=S8CL96_9LAMI|nr:hypothetical protein M569_09251 [Genlisea aurea]
MGSKIMETAPTLPDFALALKPDEYLLPPVDACWDEGETDDVSIGFAATATSKV